MHSLGIPHSIPLWGKISFACSGFPRLCVIKGRYSDIRESRICIDGKLTGSYTNSACTNLTCQLPWGGEIGEESSVVAYQIPISNSCETNKQTRYCKSGYLSGNAAYKDCKAKGCVAPVTFRPIEEGGSVDLFRKNTSDNCDSEKETRTCYNGILSGSAQYIYCAPLPVSRPPTPPTQPPQKNVVKCTTPWGATISEGEKVTAFLSLHRPCKSQIRTCTNGILSGYYFYETCF